MAELILFKNVKQLTFTHVKKDSVKFWKNYREIHFEVEDWSTDHKPRECHFFEIDGYVISKDDK